MDTKWIQRGQEVLGIEIEALAAVRDKLDAGFSQAVSLLEHCTGRVAVTGIGKSGLVGRKLAATLSSTGTPAFFLHPVEGAHGDLGALREGDVVIAISYSGKSDELNALLPALKSLGLPVIAMTGGASSPLAKLADVVINTEIPREACPLNLAPTSSTTATLALGDALAVCLIDAKHFTSSDFKKFHPAGALGQRLSLGVRNIMHTGNLPVAGPGCPAEEALAILDKGGLGALLVVEGGKLAGILTDGDLRRRLCSGVFLPQAPVSSLMTPNPCCAHVGQSAAEVMDLMEQKAITVLPVTDTEGSLAGIVHLHDLLGKGQVKFAG